ncbi:cytochrome c oxidase assembly protein PET191-domain-containing protein [Fimicolochytrium jonesii]|uniref:cytochrome c oxidase assembly protein PET191-domain-containing protein n=1 Tax=Fimicolochytrium jonesii TaxID=1396493 RepID=UPI0022FEF8D5|nr:cytochrome c oxidase assembly protein PET191-domain-containing protein [Fimicolochytrium jonesii]KAI8821326.1 cytochrome c oxidase assembly protein PET191-domain-containing protein [Fimicolochytrium jonesii]
MPTCDHFYKDLLKCLLASPCVQQHGHSPRECLSPVHDEESVSAACRLAQRAYVECKVDIMNPRKRFRGPYGGRPPKEAEDEEDA